MKLRGFYWKMCPHKEVYSEGLTPEPLGLEQPVVGFFLLFALVSEDVKYVQVNLKKKKQYKNLSEVTGTEFTSVLTVPN